MALSGSFNTNKYTTSSSGTIGLNLSWTATQNVSNNTSTIKWTLKSNGSMSSGAWVYAGPVTVTINGTKVLGTTSRFQMYGDGKYKKTGSITVTHNSDGTKSVSMSVRAAIYSTSVNCTGSSTPTLNKIDRYALLASVTDFTNESYPKVVYTNPAGTALTTGLKVRIKWKDLNDQDQATSWVTLNDEGGEYTFTSSTLTNANINNMLAACPEDSFLPVKFDLQSTMNGVEYHDYKDAVMEVVNADPTFSVQPSYEDANASVVAVTGNNQTIVQKQSKLRIYHGTAGAQKGASLANNPYRVNFNGEVYDFTGNYIEFDKPDLDGIYQVTVFATDTRGNTAMSNFDIEVLEWTEPTADCNLERQNSFESICDFKVTAHISPLGGLNPSHLSITEKHRIAGSSSWSTPASVQNDTETTIILANSSAWEMQVSVTDAFATKNYTLTVGKGIPYIFKDIYRNSIGINGIPDEDNQVLLGEDCSAKVNRVKFPPVYSSTERIVGYWTDGSAIYERTVDLGSSQSIPTNSWTDLETLTYNIKILDLVAYYDSGAGNLVYNNLIGQFVNSSKKVQVLNTRSSAITIDTFKIQYIKITA